ncbi:MAG: penicillin-binding protein 1B [Candidatus Muproteobacteria bacterium RBG_16_65_34]|uniref:Penicillin-binding protein 1B n=1 Tax=Candidatus Muproteobacteria bacterium RBG_16_65_34 TaxID=1817760 RepID=A0A1F6TP28_9PROT|nr:MAG: penicillin-binding protein 1B [Candidatus Muproteobacteria bacterium RBG_16_65_34]
MNLASLRRLFAFRRWRLLVLAALLLVAGFALYLDFRVRDAFEGKRFALPARVYARALELFPGLRLDPDALARELVWLGYREGLQGDEPGRFERRGGEFEMLTRAFTFWDGAQPAQALRLAFRDGRLHALTDRRGAPVALARLDPLPIGGIYPAHNEDRLLVRLAEVPRELIEALIAIEDRKFYSHVGLDPRGIARAALATVTGRGVQGGSTLTQQLVKNFFLTPERTLRRKFTEMLMALLLETHYGKDEILETYLNEIYLGQDRNRAIHGFGLAAQFYFGKPVSRLTLSEAALLVGMVKGPAYYDPHRHPARALERRDLVLAEMQKQERIGQERYVQARAAPLGIVDKPSMGTSPHPAFLDLVRRQLKRDYREEDLRSEGLQIFTTLDPYAQRAAERALSTRLAQLDKARGGGAPMLEGAVVVVQAQSAEVQALVSGRDPHYEGFNRALDAVRPIGSLMKPAIFLTALAHPKRYTLITPLDDAPLVWKSRGTADWEPKNYDRANHGLVPLRTALAHSYNVASARLGLDLGVSEVLDSVRRLGVAREVAPYASSLLGAVELTPLEVAQMYQTIASGGFRAPPRAIREVLTADGRPLQHYGLTLEPAVDPAPAYLLTAALQGVVREGTAQGLKNYLPPGLNAAGKTGTTDELRDSWFAGFTGDKLAVVWVGYDDNRPAQLTGSSGAMTVWGELMAALPHEPLAPPVPENIETAWIEPQSGLRADRDCAGAVELPFIRGSAPEELAPCAASTGSRIKNWFRRLVE